MNTSVFWNKEDPITTSLLEVDVYKFVMLFFIWRFFPNLQVKFGFKNRTTKVRLTDHVMEGELRSELRHVETLGFRGSEIAYLRSWGIFSESFLSWLSGLKLPPVLISADHDKGVLNITATGTWLEVTLWETIVLATVNELYTRRQVDKLLINETRLFQEGNERLSAKVELLKKHPGIKFAQFGKRRRFSKLWERHVTERVLEETPGSMIGVSNVGLAHVLGVEAVGTNAHELPMALYALNRHISDESARMSVYQVLDLWQRLYGNRLLVALPDTFGTDVFLEGMPRDQAFDWKGFRQDSGDVIEFGEKIIRFYEKLSIDPREKLLIPSDGLDIHKMIRIYEHFTGRIQTSFGWGTNLTNDLGIGPLSLVMKLTEAAGNPAVKLSDNIAKATGDVAEIEEAKRIFGYTTEFFEQPVY